MSKEVEIRSLLSKLKRDLLTIEVDVLNLMDYGVSMPSLPARVEDLKDVVNRIHCE